MSAQRDPAILLAFVDEARSYLPGIRDGLLAYLADENQASEIQSAYRLTHTIAGAASMVGLDELSAFARSTENILEEFALVGGTLSPDRGAEVLGQLDEIEQRLAVIADVAAADAGASPDAADPLVASFGEAFVFDGSPDDLGPEPLSFGNEGLEDAPADEDIDPEMLEIFRLEAEEHLRTVSASLVVLDRTPGDRPTLKDIRRSAHTLKGAAAVVGFQSVTKLAHRMEDLLDALYDNEQPATPALTSLLLAATEQLEQLVGGTPPSELAHSLEITYRQFDSILPIVQAGGVVEAIGADGPVVVRRRPARRQPPWSGRPTRRSMPWPRPRSTRPRTRRTSPRNRRPRWRASPPRPVPSASTSTPMPTAPSRRKPRPFPPAAPPTTRRWRMPPRPPARASSCASRSPSWTACPS